MAQQDLNGSSPEADESEPKGALAVGKAIAILNAFLDGSDELAPIEVARRAGISRSTCHRLLTTLQQHRYLERTDSGAYRPGIRLFQLGSLVHRPHVYARLAEPEMRTLADKMQISAFLSVHDGSQALCIARVDRGQIILAPYRVGETLPLHVGAAPMVLLAAMDDADVEAILAQPLNRLTDHTDVDPLSLRRRVAEVRSQGFAIARQDDIAVGLSAVGAPITDPTGRVVAALSLSGLVAHIQPREAEIVGEVLASARGISTLLVGDMSLIS